MSRKFIFIVPLILMVMLTACNFKPPKKLSTMEKIQIRLTELSQYISTATITKISNKGKTEYAVKQYYKMTGEYRVEFIEPKNISGNVIVNTGDTLAHMDPSIEGNISIKAAAVSDEFTHLFLGNFIKAYLQHEEATVAAHTNDSDETILEAVIAGDNEYMASEKLWIDNKSLDPKKLIIYDKNGNERTIVTYDEFNYNVDIDDNVFTLN